MSCCYSVDKVKCTCGKDEINATYDLARSSSCDRYPVRRAFRSTASRAMYMHIKRDHFHKACKDCMILENADRFLPFKIIMKVRTRVVHNCPVSFDPAASWGGYFCFCNCVVPASSSHWPTPRQSPPAMSCPSAPIPASTSCSRTASSTSSLRSAGRTSLGSCGRQNQSSGRRKVNIF